MIARIDAFIMLRMVTPIVHYIDWRWHANQYRQAAAVMTAALTICVVHNVYLAVTLSMPIGLHLLFAAALITISLLIVATYASNLIGFEKAAKEFENRPDLIPSSMRHYYFLPSTFRVGFLATAIPLTLLSYYSAWLVAVGMTYYIAVVPPSSRGRREKRQHAPLATAGADHA